LTDNRKTHNGPCGYRLAGASSMGVVAAGAITSLVCRNPKLLVLPRQIMKLLREAPPRAPYSGGLMRRAFRPKRWSARLVALTLILAAAFLML
jgi:hypothetical protein